ncbi:ScyD/ScyE family protein [Adhaeribacter radiodurans]|uniref:ScyD/ScyE family protein n=1 Tax=Adhaeribacter radiodurans TaxID=2745197 RepID=A0A7L7L8A0_9BACT|nr:ScyD/ScyE family protein [Adhaeribacter radiodurans]QMU29046.1 ScyD/ScyE family protein [Adhaeribacter radiodurans]
MKLKVTTLLFSLSLLLVTGCREFYEYLDTVEPKPVKNKEFASKLNRPVGLALDANQQLWVTEIGTGKDDGKLSVFDSNGKKHVVVVGFPSFIESASPDIVGLNHLLVKDNKVYILHTNGILYIADISNYKNGDKAVKASSLQRQNIGKFVLNYPFKEKPLVSNPYSLTVGPEDNLYITDASANAIIRRTPAGKLYVFTTFTDIKNPTPVGPPTLDVVPTGIGFNEQRFYVTTLTGFPFPKGEARIYSVDLKGKYTLYQEGFTTLTDMTFDPAYNPVVVEHAQFGQQGFTPNTGRIVVAADNGQASFGSAINQPTAIVRSGPLTYYVNSITDGKIFKVTNE